MDQEYNEMRYSSGGGPDWRKIGYTLGKHLAEQGGVHGYDVDIRTTGRNMSIENPRLVGEKEVDFSIDLNVVVNWALDGMGPYETEYSNLRGIGTIPQYDFQMSGVSPVVRADLGITTYRELVEYDGSLTLKTNNPETHVSGISFGQVLHEYGSSWEDLRATGLETITAPDGYVPDLTTGEETIEAMENGELDGGWGLEEIWKVADEIDLTVLSLDDEVAERLAEKYGHLIIDVECDFLFDGHDSFTTWGYPGQFIFTHEDIPDEFVFAVAKILNEQSLEIAWCQPGLVGRPGRHLSRMWGVPMHDGARTYYESLGWM